MDLNSCLDTTTKKGHSTELVKTGGGIKKRIFSLFAYMHYAHYVLNMRNIVIRGSHF
jgi:hypothetical protein